MGKETEAQKRASRKYYLTHKKYYSIKANEYQKRTRKLRDEYKQRIDDAIEYINGYEDLVGLTGGFVLNLKNILEGIYENN